MLVALTFDLGVLRGVFRVPTELQVLQELQATEVPLTKAPLEEAAVVPPPQLRGCSGVTVTLLLALIWHMKMVICLQRMRRQQQRHHDDGMAPMHILSHELQWASHTLLNL